MELFWLWLKWISLIVLVCMLSGCLDAAYTEADVIYNHYQVEHAWTNHWLELETLNALNRDAKITKNGNIRVTIVNGIVLLTGYVDKKIIRKRAITIVKRIHGIKQIINAIVIGKGEPAGTALKDSWITVKIKSKFILNSKIDTHAITIVTTRKGIVFLLGTVPQKMADLAAKIAGQTSGVKKVICLFQIITIKW